MYLVLSTLSYSYSVSILLFRNDITTTLRWFYFLHLDFIANILSSDVPAILAKTKAVYSEVFTSIAKLIANDPGTSVVHADSLALAEGLVEVTLKTTSGLI